MVGFLRCPAVSVAISCVLVTATVLPTALGCQVALRSGEDPGVHECCKGRKHGAACPLGKSQDPKDPDCPAMRGCNTVDGLLMSLLGKIGFFPEQADSGDRTLVATGLVADQSASFVGFVTRPDPPPPRV